MAGYLFALDSLDSLELYALNGVYGTKINRRGPFWGPYQLFTLADYLTMKPGDLVFFFIKRKIYGIGRLVSLSSDVASPVAVCNYLSSYLPTAKMAGDLLWDEGDGEDRPWVCFFEPNPSLYREGLDMDDVLDADVKGAAQALRVFEKLSFIQMDDDEVDLLSDLFVQRLGSAKAFVDEHAELHGRIRSKNLTGRFVDLDQLLRVYANSDGTVRSEAALEACLVGHLASDSTITRGTFGSLDYVTHQVPASPPKPVMYMDKIDILGWQTRPSPGPRTRTVTRYVVIEIKKDSVVGSSGPETITQLMKYVDWLAARKGGYSLIDAYLVAANFDEAAIEYARTSAVRNYIAQRRPFVADVWHRIHLVAYDTRRPDPLSLVFEVN